MIGRPKSRTCGVCGEPTVRPTRMCAACGKSYDKQARDDGSVMEAILWAAKRARWYAQRRHTERTPMTLLDAARSAARKGYR